MVKLKVPKKEKKTGTKAKEKRKKINFHSAEYRIRVVRDYCRLWSDFFRAFSEGLHDRKIYDSDEQSFFQIVSLLAMTFTYDAISGEKQDGTLRLLLAKAVPRHQILLGKWLGSYMSFLLSYIPSLIGVALLISLHPMVALTWSEWWSVVLIFALSVVYVTVFFSLGLLVSSRAREPKTSLLTLLAIWTFLALIIPNFSPYLAAEIRPTRTPYEIEAELNSIGFEETEKAWERVRESMRGIGEQGNKGTGEQRSF